MTSGSSKGQPPSGIWNITKTESSIPWLTVKFHLSPLIHFRHILLTRGGKKQSLLKHLREEITILHSVVQLLYTVVDSIHEDTKNIHTCRTWYLAQLCKQFIKLLLTVTLSPGLGFWTGLGTPWDSPKELDGAAKKTEVWASLLRSPWPDSRKATQRRWMDD